MERKEFSYNGMMIVEKKCASESCQREAIAPGGTEHNHMAELNLDVDVGLWGEGITGALQMDFELSAVHVSFQRTDHFTWA